MHKSMQMQLQQRGGGAASVGSSSFSSSGGGGTGGLDVSKPHQCQQCLKSFSSNHQLVQHIRVHTGEKPYKCSYCERRFKQLSHVQQHTRLHTGTFSLIMINIKKNISWNCNAKKILLLNNNNRTNMDVDFRLKEEAPIDLRWIDWRLNSVILLISHDCNIYIYIYTKMERGSIFVY